MRGVTRPTKFKEPIFESVAKEKALSGETEKKLVEFLDKFAKGFTA